MSPYLTRPVRAAEITQRAPGPEFIRITVHYAFKQLEGGREMEMERGRGREDSVAHLFPATAEAAAQPLDTTQPPRCLTSSAFAHCRLPSADCAPTARRLADEPPPPPTLLLLLRLAAE